MGVRRGQKRHRWDRPAGSYDSVLVCQACGLWKRYGRPHGTPGPEQAFYYSVAPGVGWLHRHAAPACKPKSAPTPSPHGQTGEGG